MGANSRIKGRHILLVGLLFLAGWIVWGNQTIVKTHFSLASAEVPLSFEGYTIAQLSDLHNKDWGDSLVELLRVEAPDVILVTGDLIDSNHPDLETAVNFAEEAMAIAPVYFVSGNHEAWSGRYDELKARLTALGVHILDNETRLLQRGGETIRLLGLSDPAIVAGATEYIEEAAILENELSGLNVSQAGFEILLTHRPEQFDGYVHTGVDLVLAGHAHGGQFRLPFIGGIIAPDQGFFPRYTAGLYEEDNTRMIVSRGLGNSIIPFRINNNPELVIIKLSR